MTETGPATEGGFRVLIVDDVEDVLDVLSDLLRGHGYSVVAAPSAPAALEAARARHFDLVVSDIGMPAVNGYELAAQLRSLTEYRSTPMLAVSGFGEYDDRGQALAAGFDEYLGKPIAPVEFLRTVERLLSARLADRTSPPPDSESSA